MSSDTPKPRFTNLPNIEPKVSAKIAVDAVLKVFTTFRDLTTEATLGDRRGIEGVIVENYEAITAALEAVRQLAADVDVLEEVIILADEEAQGGKVVGLDSAKYRRDCETMGLIGRRIAVQADAKAELDAKRSAAARAEAEEPPPVDAHAGWRRPFRFMSSAGRVGPVELLRLEIEDQRVQAEQRAEVASREALRLLDAAKVVPSNTPAAIAARRTADRLVAAFREEGEACSRLARDLAAVIANLDKSPNPSFLVSEEVGLSGGLKVVS